MTYPNPYAAPQSVECAIDPRKLPTATLASSGMLRRAWPVVSTRELARLVRQSRALDDMQLVWMWVTPLLLVAILVCFCIRDFDDANAPLDYIPLVLGAGLCLARLILGHGRSVVGRYVSLLIDSVLVAACVALVTFLTLRWIGESFQERCYLVFCAAFLGFPIYFGYPALVAMLEARGLFGRRRCRHQELLDELGYRQELGIE